MEYTIRQQRQCRINALIHTSVDDCRLTLACEKDPEFLREILTTMVAQGITGKTRRQVIERRLRALERSGDGK